MSSTPPDHWSQFVSIANWFTLHYPQSWQTEEASPGTMLFQPTGSHSMVAIKSVWLEPEEFPKQTHLKRVIDKFPKVRQVKDAFDAHHPHLIECLQGEGLIGSPVTWWKAAFQKPDWRRWKIWALQNNRLLIVVTLLHDQVYDPELESIMRILVENIRIADHPASPPDVFLDQAYQLAKEKFPLLVVKRVGHFSLQLDLARVNLSNLYLSYSRQPENFQKLVLPALTAAVQIQDWNEVFQSPPIEMIRERLMPMVFPETTWKEKFPEMVGQTWVAGLAVLYVVDEANSYWYISKEILARLELSIDDLHEIAITNLHSHFRKHPMELTRALDDDDSQSVIMPVKADSFNTTRLLSSDFLQKLRQFSRCNVVIGAPGRDVFIVVPTSNSELVDLLRKAVKEDLMQNEHPLTDRLMLVSADGVSEFLD